MRYEIWIQGRGLAQCPEASGGETFDSDSLEDAKEEGRESIVTWQEDGYSFYRLTVFDTEQGDTVYESTWTRQEDGTYTEQEEESGE